MDLAWAQKRAQLVYCKGKMRGMPAVVEELLLRWINDCEEMLKSAEAKAAPPPGMDGPPPPPGDMGPPPGPPMPMPAAA